ncbi:DUF3379 domain-containing protein [Shewanella sp. 3B26]|jgi:hypothetical protein|uniref:DUF3379 domain-containing protein n=1 Tax=Shewanella zhuhaiensis TaxID=2919576 RepID=A0AAJ1BFR8_9GAMM|nr:DUF3379 domain-containing protein [Shewanella zhuhaiensis]MCH4293978.1 DUF3379 domain-containing protein [Shewanella zhuhaiensis]
MDELEFRRRAYGEPQSQDPEFLKAMGEAEGRDAFVNDLKSLDRRLEKAMKVDVPEDLAEKLLLRQQLTQHHQSRRRTTFMVAMAASIAFAFGLSFSLLRLGPVDLGEHALAHVYHETKALKSESDVALGDLNASLVSIRGLEQAHFNTAPGRVVYKAYCDFQGVRSLHLVLEGAEGKVTLFIVPLEERMQLDEQFADNHYQGLGFKTDEAFMLLVGEQASALEAAKKEIRQSFI